MSGGVLADSTPRGSASSGCFRCPIMGRSAKATSLHSRVVPFVPWYLGVKKKGYAQASPSMVPVIIFSSKFSLPTREYWRFVPHSSLPSPPPFQEVTLTAQKTFLGGLNPSLGTNRQMIGSLPTTLECNLFPPLGFRVSVRSHLRRPRNSMAGRSGCHDGGGDYLIPLPSLLISRA